MSEENLNTNETIELLKEIKSQNKKKLFYTRIMTAIFLVICIAFLSVVPSVLSTLKTTENTMAHLNNTITTMDTTLEEISGVVDMGGESIADALEKINKIDIETLNVAINDLKEVVEPMANFFGKFR